MPRLITVDVIADSSPSGSIDVRFTTTRALLTAVDTAVLMVFSRPGSEFSIRLERGRVTDVHLWDAERALRQALPLQNVSISDGAIHCDIPKEVLPKVASVAQLSAALIVNGALVQSGFPVSWSPPATSALGRPNINDQTREGLIHG